MGNRKKKKNVFSFNFLPDLIKLVIYFNWAAVVWKSPIFYSADTYDSTLVFQSPISFYDNFCYMLSKGHQRSTEREQNIQFEDTQLFGFWKEDHQPQLKIISNQNLTSYSALAFNKDRNLCQGEKKSAVISVEFCCQLHKMCCGKQSLFLLQVVSLTQKNKLNSVEPICDSSLIVHYESDVVGKKRATCLVS